MLLLSTAQSESGRGLTWSKHEFGGGVEGAKSGGAASTTATASEQITGTGNSAQKFLREEFQEIAGQLNAVALHASSSRCHT